MGRDQSGSEVMSFYYPGLICRRSNLRAYKKLTLTTMSSVLVTGVSGQDGAYLSQLLFAHGHTVYGTHRRTGLVSFWRLQDLGIAEHPNLRLVEFDVTDLGACLRLMQEAQPDFRA